MQVEAEQTLQNINIIASLETNDKLLTNSSIFTVYQPTWYRSIYRTYYNENREANIFRIQQTIRSAKDFIENAICGHAPPIRDVVYSTPIRVAHLKNLKFLLRMHESLRMCINGLQHLEKTYYSDSASKTKIEMLTNEVRDFIDVTQFLLPQAGMTELKHVMRTSPIVDAE
tara:strand:+ start:167 stop:679 length:513 start_codon:yes stop_codon:yes gene_type:complete